MSIPYPDVQVSMFKEMLERNYKFNIGDICEITAEWMEEYKGRQTEIWFPYYYKEKGEQTYITILTPVPLADSELKFIKKNPNGKEKTYEYLKQCLEKSNSKEYRDSYVSV